MTIDMTLCTARKEDIKLLQDIHNCKDASFRAEWQGIHANFYDSFVPLTDLIELEPIFVLQNIPLSYGYGLYTSIKETFGASIVTDDMNFRDAYLDNVEVEETVIENGREALGSLIKGLVASYADNIEIMRACPMKEIMWNMNMARGISMLNKVKHIIGNKTFNTATFPNWLGDASQPLDAIVALEYMKAHIDFDSNVLVLIGG